MCVCVSLHIYYMCWDSEPIPIEQYWCKRPPSTIKRKSSHNWSKTPHIFSKHQINQKPKGIWRSISPNNNSSKTKAIWIGSERNREEGLCHDIDLEWTHLYVALGNKYDVKGLAMSKLVIFLYPFQICQKFLQENLKRYYTNKEWRRNSYINRYMVPIIFINNLRYKQVK